MVSSSVSADTAINLNTFTNAFDLSFDTETTAGTWNADTHAYLIDLNTTYSGFAVITMVLSNSNASGSSGFRVGAGNKVTSMSGGLHTVSWNKPFRDSSVADHSIYAAISGVVTGQHIMTFVGRKIGIQGEQNAYAGSYRFKDISVYGVTNGFNSFTGTKPQ
jgi:hypothetical protein